MTSAETELQIACSVGNLKKFSEYVDKVDDLDFRDNQGKSLLHLVTDICKRETEYEDKAEICSRLGIMRILLKKNVYTEFKDVELGRTPLLVAIHRGFFSAAEILIQAGANINGKDECGKCPLLEAIEAGDHGILSLLCKYRALLEQVESQAMLIAALKCDVKTMEILLVHGADANRSYIRHSFGARQHKLTLLHVASSNKKVDIVKLLLRFGADPTLRHEDGMYDIHYMSEVGDAEVLRLLLAKGASVGAMCPKQETALFRACLSGNLVAFQLLLEHGADPFHRNIRKESLMPFAIVGGNVTIIRSLALLGVKFEKIDYEIITSRDNTIVYKADDLINDILCCTFSPLEAATICGHQEVVEYLLRIGIQLEYAEKQSFSIIHWASYSGSNGIINIELSSDVDINVRGADFRTPLHVAAICERVETCKHLIDLGANTRMVDLYGNTAMQFAIKSKNHQLVRLLQKVDPCYVSELDMKNSIPDKGTTFFIFPGMIDVMKFPCNYDKATLYSEVDGVAFACSATLDSEEHNIATDNSDVEEDNISIENMDGENINITMDNRGSSNISSSELIIRHTIKLRVAGIDRVDKYLDVISGSDRNYYLKCLEEIISMRQVKINATRTLHDFLRCSFKLGDEYIRTAESQNRLSAMTPFKDFLIYSDLLQNKLDKLVQIKYLVDVGSKFFWSINAKLPYECREIMVSYLNISTLLALEEVLTSI